MLPGQKKRELSIMQAMPETTSDGSARDLIDILRRRAPRAAVGIAAARWAWPVGKKLYETSKKHTTYTITVQKDGWVGSALQGWIMTDLKPKRQRSRHPQSWWGGEKTEMRFDGGDSYSALVSFAGHRVLLYVYAGEENEYTGKWKRGSEPSYKFTVFGDKARIDVEAKLIELWEAGQDTPEANLSFFVGTQWGSWRQLPEVQRRELDSVVLPDGRVDFLVNDLTEFLGNEAVYASKGIPWHRGYLFSGPPGTGKTTVARALATHFKLPVCFVSLSTIPEDETLMSLITELPPRSLLLLEDIDVFDSAKKRTDDKKGVTLSGLLNALDGFGTPHGLVTIMTTNHDESLDEALMRPGRVDVHERFDLADQKQINEFVRVFYGGDWVADLPDDAKMGISTVQGILQPYFDDPLGGIVALEEAAHPIAAVTS